MYVYMYPYMCPFSVFIYKDIHTWTNKRPTADKGQDACFRVIASVRPWSILTPIKGPDSCSLQTVFLAGVLKWSWHACRSILPVGQLELLAGCDGISQDCPVASPTGRQLMALDGAALQNLEVYVHMLLLMQLLPAFGVQSMHIAGAVSLARMSCL